MLQASTSLECEPSPEPIYNSAKYLFSNRELYRTPRDRQVPLYLAHKKPHPPGPYSRMMSRALGGSYGGGRPRGCPSRDRQVHTHYRVPGSCALQGHLAQAHYRGTSRMRITGVPRSCALQGHLTRTHYRGTLLMRNRTPLRPYSRMMPEALWGPFGGGGVLMSAHSLVERLSHHLATETMKAYQKAIVFYLHG